jgi:hypothetical protein
VALTEQKWYNWNSKNKKMLLIALCNSLEPVKIEFFALLPINYASGVAVSNVFRKCCYGE